MKGKLGAWLGLWLGLGWSMGAPAAVELPSGQYHFTVAELRVKVPGGIITAERTWYDRAWHFNRAWNALVIEYDALDGSVKRLVRNGDRYDRSSDGTRFVFDARKVIVPLATGFRWEDRDGHWIEYDASGRITRYGDRTGVIATFSYDTEERRTGVLDRTGRQVLWYEYTDGRLSAVRDGTTPTPRRVEYHYTNGQLTEALDARGESWKYEYQNSLLTKRTDPLGHSTLIAYNAAGRAATITHADGTKSEYAYDYDSTRKEYYTRATEPGGRVTERWYDKTEVIRIDVNGRTVETMRRDWRKRIYTDARGLETAKDYDEWDNLLKITYPDGTTASRTVDPATSNVLQAVDERGNITAYAYSSAGRLIRLTEAKGTPAERITEYGYDAAGNLTQVKRLADATTAEALTVYSNFDVAGNPRTITDPEGAVHGYTYDNAGNVLTYTDPRGKTWSRTYDAAGHLLTLTDPLNHATRFEYDAAGNLKKRIEPAPFNYETVFGYDARDRLTTITDALGKVTRFTPDAAGRVQSIIDAAGKVLVQQVSYDADGHISQVTDGAGNVTAYDYGLGGGAYPGLLNAITYPTYAVRYGYDARGRPTAVTEDLGGGVTQTTASAYYPDGPLQRLTDPKSRATAFEYDGLGRPTRVTDPANGTTQLAYDDRDNLLAVTNARNIVIRRYEYDRTNRLTKEIRPDNTSYQYSYDDATGSVTRTDAKGQQTRYLHDDAGRLTSVEYYDAGAPSPAKTVSFSYDERNLLTGYNDGITSATYTYDALGRKTAETVNYGTFSLSYGYDYDAAGRKTAFTGPDNLTVTYSYDAAGRLAAISLPGAGSFTLGDYRWFAPTRLTLPGGGTREWTFDALMRPAHITGRDPAGNPVLDYGYGFDAVGNITSKSTEHGPYTYGYDALDRLTAVDNPTLPDEAYTYDAVGNRLTDAKVTGTWGYSDSDELQGYGGVTLTYDANGSLTQKNASGTITQYIYNLENRLAEVRDGAGALIARYGYDPFGRRLWKEVGGTKTYFLYAEEGLIAEADASGTITRLYGWQPDGAWGTDPLYLKTNGQIYFYVNDHLGTPQKLVGVNGAVVWAAKFEAFGVVYTEVGQVENPLRLPGQYVDGETGLYYNYYRTYDPSIGRYLESDPIGLKGGINTYAYVGSNPLSRTDPFGLLSRCERVLDSDAVPVGDPNNYPPHVYSCVPDPDDPKKQICDGQTNPTGAYLLGRGGSTRDRDQYDPNLCKDVPVDDNDCLNKCMLRKYNEPRPKYTPVPPYANPTSAERCDEWTDRRIQDCIAECRTEYEKWRSEYSAKYCGGTPCWK